MTLPISVLNKWYLVIEIPQYFQKCDTEEQEPAATGGTIFALRATIARHRESTPSFLSLEMDRSASRHLTLWRTMKVSRHMFGCFCPAPPIKPGSYIEGYDYEEHKF